MEQNEDSRFPTSSILIETFCPESYVWTMFQFVFVPSDANRTFFHYDEASLQNPLQFQATISAIRLSLNTIITVRLCVPHAVSAFSLGVPYHTLTSIDVNYFSHFAWELENEMTHLCHFTVLFFQLTENWVLALHTIFTLHTYKMYIANTYKYRLVCTYTAIYTHKSPFLYTVVTHTCVAITLWI